MRAWPAPIAGLSKTRKLARSPRKKKARLRRKAKGRCSVLTKPWTEIFERASQLQVLPFQSGRGIRRCFGWGIRLDPCGAVLSAHGARPRDIELGKDYLRESPRRRRALVDANMRAYLENSNRNEEQADSFTYNVPGTKTVITPQSWKERALQVGYPFERRSANGGAQRAQYGVRDTGEYAVSVITSLYKGRKYIDRFLKNIVTQTIFDRSELIIIDANSPEGESEIIEANMKHYQNIVYLRMAHRIGIYDAWNIGVNMSRGSYLTNANVDDVRARNSLELQAAALDAHAFADVVYQDYYTTFDFR